MSEAYNIINKSLNKTRRDYLFPPHLLDELEENERREIEGKIIKYCLLGDSVCFQYISHLKYYNLDIFNDENMKNITTTKRALIYKRLYYLTKNNDYISKLYEIAKVDINAYSILTLIYQDDDIDKVTLYTLLEKLSTLSDDYKKMFDIRCKDNDEKDMLSNKN